MYFKECHIFVIQYTFGRGIAFTNIKRVEKFFVRWILIEILIIKRNFPHPH
jgi:hypothetical protein